MARIDALKKTRPLGTALVAAATLGLYGAGMAYPEHLWGVHHFIFLSPALGWGLLVGMLLLGAVVVWGPLPAVMGRVLARVPVWGQYAVLAGGAMGLFAIARIRHRIFGDSLIRLAEVAGQVAPGRRGHELDTELRRFLHQHLGQGWGWEAETTYALVSVLCGGLFVAAALGTARQLGQGPAQRAVLLIGQCSGGGMLLFCGYLETYGSAVAFSGVYLWALTAYMQGRVGCWAPLAALGLAGMLHVLSLFALPALVWAVALRQGWVPPQWPRKWPRLAPVLAVVGATAAGALLFELVRPYSKVPFFEVSTMRHLPYRVLDPDHLLDLCNFNVLTALPGWLGLALGAVVGRRGSGDAVLQPLGVGAVVSLAMWGMVNPALGSMDWDLMALGAPLWNLFGLYYFVRRLPPPPETERLPPAAWALLGLNLLHTMPWIALQWAPGQALGSIQAMVQRDRHLVGYRGGVLGVNMLIEGHREAALQQLEQQLERGSRDPVVLRSVGQLYLKDGRYDEVEGLLPGLLGQVADQGAIRLLRAFRQRAPDGGRRSLAILEEVIRRHPHPTYFGVLAEWYGEAGQRQKLLELTRYLDKTIARAEAERLRLGDDGPRLLDLGALYLRRGRVDEAGRCLRRARDFWMAPDQRRAVEDLLEIVEKSAVGAG